MKPVSFDLTLFNTVPLNSAKNSEQTENNKTSFADFFKEALQQVDSLQKDASASALRLLTGEEEYLHNVMIAYEKASLALQLTVEIRDKLVDAYHELMRMQM